MGGVSPSLTVRVNRGKNHESHLRHRPSRPPVLHLLPCSAYPTVEVTLTLRQHNDISSEIKPVTFFVDALPDSCINRNTMTDTTRLVALKRTKRT